MIACSSGDDSARLDRDAFENEWWGTEEFPICFNFHETGDVLIYEERIRSEGSWEFCNPNEYIFAGGTEVIEVIAVEECWEIVGYSKKKTFLACACLEREAPALKNLEL